MSSHQDCPSTSPHKTLYCYISCKCKEQRWLLVGTIAIFRVGCVSRMIFVMFVCLQEDVKQLIAITSFIMLIHFWNCRPEQWAYDLAAMFDGGTFLEWNIISNGTTLISVTVPLHKMHILCIILLSLPPPSNLTAQRSCYVSWNFHIIPSMLLFVYAYG